MTAELVAVGGAGPYCTVCGHTVLHDARTCVHLACDACRAGTPVLDGEAVDSPMESVALA